MHLVCQATKRNVIIIIGDVKRLLTAHYIACGLIQLVKTELYYKMWNRRVYWYSKRLPKFAGRLEKLVPGLRFAGILHGLGKLTASGKGKLLNLRKKLKQAKESPAQLIQDWTHSLGDSQPEEYNAHPNTDTERQWRWFKTALWKLPRVAGTETTGTRVSLGYEYQSSLT